jgi:hypothetical protein
LLLTKINVPIDKVYATNITLRNHNPGNGGNVSDKKSLSNPKADK